MPSVSKIAPILHAFSLETSIQAHKGKIQQIVCRIHPQSKKNEREEMRQAMNLKNVSKKTTCSLFLHIFQVITSVYALITLICLN